MRKQVRNRVRVTGPAQRDIASIIRWSVEEFGKAASMRYRALIVQALDDIGGNPKRPGSRELPTIMVDGARTYHLAFSRGRGGVKEPRHFLLYRKREDDVIEVARVLHDSRNLELHLPKDYRNPTSESS